MEDFLKPRTVMICDSAEFSDHLGYIDEVILETEVKVFSISHKCQRNISKMKNSDKKFDYFKSHFLNGEMMTIKTFKKTKDTSSEKCLTLLSHEYKIVKLVGEHENVIDLIGISPTTFLLDGSFGLVSHFVSELTF